MTPVHITAPWRGSRDCFPLLAKWKTHERLCTWSKQYCVFADQVFCLVSQFQYRVTYSHRTSAPCSSNWICCIFEDNLDWNADSMLATVLNSQRNKMTQLDNREQTRQSVLKLGLFWSSVLPVLSTPAEVDQWILCMSIFSHAGCRPEQGTCSLINQ